MNWLLAGLWTLLGGITVARGPDSRWDLVLMFLYGMLTALRLRDALR